MVDITDEESVGNKYDTERLEAVSSDKVTIEAGAEDDTQCNTCRRRNAKHAHHRTNTEQRHR